MSNKLQLRLVSPSKLVYENDVDMVIMRTSVGDIGVLPGHENLTTILVPGMLRIVNEGKEEAIAVMNGFCEVTPEGVTILSDAAEPSETIDISRAEQSKQRAEERIRQSNEDIDTKRAELALRRALIRIETAKFHK